MNDMGGHNLLLDTNILLDAAIERRPHSEEACRVLRLCNGAGDVGYACSLSLKDVYYVVSKLYGEQQARAALEILMGLVIIAPVGMEECAVSMHGNEPDFEDGLVRATAELNEFDFIITRDKKAFQHSTVRALDAEEYIRLFSPDAFDVKKFFGTN